MDKDLQQPDFYVVARDGSIFYPEWVEEEGRYETEGEVAARVADYNAGL